MRRAANGPRMKFSRDGPVNRPNFRFFTKEGTDMATKSTAKARPIHEIRLGRIRAAIWENETQNGTRHNVTVSRLYKDGNDWKDSTSFGRDDLPLVGKVCDQAHSWIFEQNGAGSNGNGSSDNDGSESF